MNKYKKRYLPLLDKYYISKNKTHVLSTVVSNCREEYSNKRLYELLYVYFSEEILFSLPLFNSLREMNDWLDSREYTQIPVSEIEKYKVLGELIS